MATDEMIARLARSATAYFTTKEVERDGTKTTIVVYTDDAPEWLTDLTREAHNAGAMLPDDGRYMQIRSALDAIADESATLDDHHEWADSEIDAYTGARIAWLAQGNRYTYCDQAQEEGVAEPGASILDLIAAGQYMEACETFASVWASLDDAAGDNEDGDGDDEEVDDNASV